MRLTLGAAILAYLAFLAVLAYRVQDEIHDEADYLVAGRRLPMWLSVGTLFATWFGAGTLLTATDEIRESGLRAAALEPYGAGLCLIVAGLLMAKPLWESGVLTLSDLWRQRFGPRAEALGVIVSVPSFGAWVAVQLIALAGILELFFGLDRRLGILVVAAVALAYTLSGGMWSVTLTDTAQMALILPGLILLFWKVMGAVGGWGGLSAAVPAADLTLVPRESLAAFGGWVNLLMIGALGNLASQDLAQRILSARSAEVARRSCFVSGALYLLFGSMPVLMGLASRVLLPDTHDHSTIPALAQALLSPGMTVIITLSMISVVVSTITSGILAPAAILSHNAMRYWVDRDYDKVRLARIAVVLVTAMSVVFALSGEESFSLLEEAYAIGLVGFFAPMLFALYGKAWDEGAAIAAMAVGTGVWALKFCVETDLPVDLAATALSGAAYWAWYRLVRAGKK